MTRSQLFARTLVSLLVPAAVLLVLTLSAVAEELDLPLRQGKAARVTAARVIDGSSRLTLSAPDWITASRLRRWSTMVRAIMIGPTSTVFMNRCSLGQRERGCRAPS